MRRGNVVNALIPMSGTELTVGPETQPPRSDIPKEKPAPEKGKFPLKFVYHPSPDGIDENLLIMLHGLGKPNNTF